MDFFVWMANLGKTSPFAHAGMVIVVMAAVGVGFALVADVAVKAMGINVGSYKKEYEEEEEEKTAGAH